MWRLQLLGSCRLERDGVMLMPSAKVQALLGLLGCAGTAGLAREQVVALLWEDAPPARARQSLRQLLSDLRRDSPVLQIGGSEHLLLAPDSVGVDLWQLERAAHSAELQRLEPAAALYAGPLLQGIPAIGAGFDDWLAGERARVERLARSVFEQSARVQLAASRHEAALPWLQRWLDLDPGNELAHRLVMQAWAALGRRSEALAQFDRCAEILRREYGTSPQAETSALRASLRGTAAAETPSHGRSASDGALALAVLPLAVLPQEPALETLAAVLAEDLGAALARQPELAVTAQAAVRAVALRAQGDLLRMAEMLKVRYLVVGGLRRTPEAQLRLSLHLVAGEDALYLWSLQETFDAAPASALLDERIAAWAADIDLQVSVAWARRQRRGEASEGADARDLVRDANSTLFARGWAEDAVHAALDFYRHAIAADPKHALARAQKAIVMALAGNMGLLPGESVREEARAEAERALELEPRNSEVLGYAGCALADLGDPRRAVPFIQRAVDTNPGNPQAWAALGAAHLILGETERGIEQLRRGLRLSPDDYRRPVWYTLLTGALQRQDRLDEAAEAAEAACRADPRFWPARIVRAVVEMERGRRAEAMAALREAHRIRPRLSPPELRVWVRKRRFEALMALWGEVVRPGP
jgi:DNA-binding SARP family transcriptional activator/Flp pilus assembly protein TadD